MSKVLRTVFAAAVAVTLVPAAQAAPVTFTVDGGHSNVQFTVRHMVVTNVTGSFNQFDGTVVMDAEKPEASSVDFTIQVGSVDTGNENRDKHLKSADFFDAEKFPTITFKSTAAKKLSAEEWEVTGDLTMRGVTKSVTLPVSFLGEAKDPRGNLKAGFSTTVKINRKDFGVSWNQNLDSGGVVVSDEVKVTVDLAVVAKK